MKGERRDLYNTFSYKDKLKSIEKKKEAEGIMGSKKRMIKAAWKESVKAPEGDYI